MNRRVALVSGSSRGIGAAIARTFAAERMDLAKITVNAVAPGLIDAEEPHPDEARGAAASDKAAYITGQVISIPGGLRGCDTQPG